MRTTDGGGCWNFFLGGSEDSSCSAVNSLCYLTNLSIRLLFTIHRNDSWKTYSSWNPSRDVPEVVLNTKAVPTGLLLHPQIHSGCPRVLSVNRDLTPCVSNTAPVFKQFKEMALFYITNRLPVMLKLSQKPKDMSYIFVYLLLPSSNRQLSVRFHLFKRGCLNFFHFKQLNCNCPILRFLLLLCWIEL